MMNREQFDKEILNIITSMTKEYQEAKKNKYVVLGKKIFRGRIKAKSSLFEDKFAEFIFDIMDENVEVFIDQSISIKPDSDKKAKTYYPDILIVKETNILAIIELKIDLGFYKKDVLTKYKDMISDLKKYPITSKNQKLFVSPELSFALVVLTSANSHNVINDMNKDDLYILMNYKIHPNAEILEEEKYITEATSNRNQWGSLYKFCENIYSKI